MNGAVEGLLDEVVLRRLMKHCHAQIGTIRNMGGKSNLLRRLDGFNQAAQYAPWVVLIDLDDDAECAPSALAQWLSQRSAQMRLCIAVREVEAWLLADAVGMARLLGVEESRIQGLGDPDHLNDPKGAVVGLARHSQGTAIKNAIVPRPGSGRAEGGGYTATMTTFVAEMWNIDDAMQRSDSLNRAILRICAEAALEIL